jgi:hypothetical protein
MSDDSALIDGDEPSISVKLLDVPKNAGGVKFRSGRIIVINEIKKITNAELVDLGAFAHEIVGDIEKGIDDIKEDLSRDSGPETPPNLSAANPAGSLYSSPVNQSSSLPGQSG